MSGELRSLVPVPPNTSAPPCPLDGTGPVAELDRQIAHQQLPVIVLLLLVCILGTVGNLLVILVSIHRRRKSSATVFILALAAVDFFISAVTIPMRVFSYFHYSFSAPGWCELESCLTVGSLVSSLLLLVAIAEDRLRAVRRPTHFYMAGNRRAVHVSVAVLIVGFVLSLPYLMTAHEGAFLLPERNCTVTACFGITTNNHAWSLASFILITIPFFSSGFIIVVIYAMVRSVFILLLLLFLLPSSLSSSLSPSPLPPPNYHHHPHHHPLLLIRLHHRSHLRHGEECLYSPPPPLPPPPFHYPHHHPLLLIRFRHRSHLCHGEDGLSSSSFFFFSV
ncbi:alpha-2 adrenergic receptor-like [Branchiostoma floridae x Branchiostoma japonicum]